MKKFTAILLTLFACALAASAQSSLDNFDLRNGVQVYTPPAPPAPAKKVGTLLKRTVYTAPPDLRMANGTSLDGYSTGNATFDDIIVQAARHNQLDPLLIYATMHTESTFHPKAISPKGASGLMQLMPGTAARFGVTNIFDPRQNVEAGAKYMRYLMDMFNQDVRLTLAGYNAGEGAVMRFGYRIPPFNETQEYVRRITARYAMMRDPGVAQHARAATATEVASTRQNAIPLNVYERSLTTVRLADGRLVLLSQ